MRLIFLLTVSLLFLSSCYAARPVVSIDQGVSFARYQALEVMPVIDKTGKTFQFDVAQTLTQKIRDQLKEQGLVVVGDGEGDKETLSIKSDLIAYEPGNAVTRWVSGPLVPAGKTQATVKTTLIDKRSGDRIGDIATAEVVSGGGLYSMGADKWILEVVAKGIAQEIGQRLNK